jgi:hypothetical protein
MGRPSFRPGLAVKLEMSLHQRPNMHAEPHTSLLNDGLLITPEHAVDKVT